MNSIKNIILGFGIAVLSIPAFSQNPNLPTEEVNVIKDFDARLQETERFTINPALPSVDTTTKIQTYDILQKTMSVEYLPPKIRPIAMKGDELQKGYTGFAQVGLGLPSQIYADASYHIITESKLNVDFDIFHHSANNDRNVENQRFSSSKAGIDAIYFFDQGFAVNGRIGYSRDVVHFYGYNDLNEEFGSEISFLPDQVKQRFAMFDATVSIFNGERTVGDLSYYATLDLYSLRDNYASRENGYDIKLGATKWFNDTHPLAIELRTDFTSFKDTTKQSLNNLTLSPSYTFHGDIFKAKIGARLASSQDQLSIFPDLEVTLNVVDGVLGAYVGAEGNLQKNNFRALTSYNPYLESIVDIRNTSYINLYGGIKGTIVGVDYDAQVGYKSADDLAMYLLSNNGDSIPRFDAIYDTVDIFVIKATILAPIFDNLSFDATISQSVFNPKNEEKAWHLPTTSLDLGATLTMFEEALLFRVDVFFENGVPYKDVDGMAQNLNALIDVNLGANYFFSENIGAFVKVNNVINNKRQRWHRYPQLGINAMVGITARF